MSSTPYNPAQKQEKEVLYVFTGQSRTTTNTIKMGEKERWRGSGSSMHSSAAIPSAAITSYHLYKHYANVCAAVQRTIM